MTENLNVFQTMLRFSEAANLFCDHVHTTKHKRLYDLAQQAIEGPESSDGTSKWKIAWGPVISKNDFGGDTVFGINGNPIEFEDGMVYETTVIAFGAAAGFSNLLEALGDISSVVDLDEWASSQLDGLKKPPKVETPDSATSLDGRACIANGFAQALFRLINSNKPVAPYPSDTILDFVNETLKKPNAKLVFTGHSIGGALAYAFAYVLAKAKIFGPPPYKQIHVYVTGAPSIGNRTFVDRFGADFPPMGIDGYRRWNLNIVNPFDPIPHAYCTDRKHQAFTLQKISSLYSKPEHLPEEVESTLANLVAKAKDLYYAFPLSTFKSQIPKPPMSPGTYVGFLLCAGQQHISAYKAYILASDTKP